RAAAAGRPLSVRWEQRDMRDLPWSGAFDGAFCFGNSFGYYDEEGNADFLKAVARTLKPGARFLLDTSYLTEGLLPNLQERAWYPSGAWPNGGTLGAAAGCSSSTALYSTAGWRSGPCRPACTPTVRFAGCSRRPASPTCKASARWRGSRSGSAPRRCSWSRRG